MINSTWDVLTKTKLLVIGAGKHQVDVIKKSALAGYETIAVDIDPLAEGFTYAHQTFVQSAYDHEEILQSLERTGQSDEICGVITQAARDCIPVVSRLSESLGLQHLDAKVASLSLQKGKLSKRLNPHVFIGEFDHVDGVVEWPDFPFVFKWEGTSGGAGVHVIRSANKLARIRSIVPPGHPIIIEEFVAGRSFGIMGLASEGEIKFYGVAEKFLRDDLAIDEVVFPATINYDLHEGLISYCKKILRDLEFNFGPFQLELILDEEQRPYFVELEASVMGSYISEWVIPATSSNDMVMDSIKLACEGSFDPQIHKPVLSSLLKYHYPPETGTLDSFCFRNINRRVLFKPYFNSGDHIRDKRMYIANSFILGKELTEMRRTLQSQKIQVNINP